MGWPTVTPYTSPKPPPNSPQGAVPTAIAITSLAVTELSYSEFSGSSSGVAPIVISGTTVGYVVNLFPLQWNGVTWAFDTGVTGFGGPLVAFPTVDALLISCQLPATPKRLQPIWNDSVEWTYYFPLSIVLCEMSFVGNETANGNFTLVIGTFGHNSVMTAGRITSRSNLTVIASGRTGTVQPWNMTPVQVGNYNVFGPSFTGSY